MIAMTKRERVMAAVKGEPLDRVPISFFGHNYRAERSTDTLVANLLKQNSKFDWDFLKVHISATYYGEAWGCKYRWDPERSPIEGPVIDDPCVKCVEDLKKLRRLDPTKGAFGEQLNVTKRLGGALERSLPYIHTIFSPLAVVERLTGTGIRTPAESTLIKKFMKEDPEAMHHALSVVSQTLADYARQVIRAGADGIFSTTTVWSRDTITEDEYKIFGRPYDLAIYEAANQEGATFNILHICRENIMFDLLSHYPVQVINYDALSPRNPSLQVASRLTDKSLWGGINERTTLLNGPLEAIVAQVHSALEQTAGRRFLLGPGCAIPPQVPDSHLLAVKEAVFTWQRRGGSYEG